MRLIVVVVAAILFSSPSWAWETRVLTYRGMQPVSMSHEEGGVLVSFHCVRDPAPRNFSTTR